MEQPYRLCLADNLMLLRSALARVLNDVKNLEVVGEASDGRELLQLAARHDPDLIVMELSLPFISGLEVIKTLRQQGSTVKILVLTEYTAPKYRQAAFDAGAQAYLTKHASLDECFLAIQCVLEGKQHRAGD